MKKLIVILALVLCAAFVFGGCTTSSQTAQSSEPAQASVETSKSAEATQAASSAAAAGDLGFSKIGICHYDQAWEMYKVMEEAIQNLADTDGIEVLTANASGDATKQLQQVETMIQSGVDAIFCVTVDGTVLEDAVKKAQDAGITFISLFVAVDVATVNIEVDEYQYGYEIGKMAGEYCAKNFPGEKIEAAKLRMFNYKPGIARGQGMEEAFLEFFPTGVIVNDQDSMDVDSAMTATEAILAANPDCRVFLCDSDDTGAIGAYQVLLAKVKEADYAKYCVIGADGTEQGIKYVKEGGMYRGTIDIQTPKIGEQCYQIIKDIKAGKTVEQTQYISIKPVTYDVATAEY